MRSTNCGNVPAERRASIGPIGKPWHRIAAGRCPAVDPVGTVRWHASEWAPERNVPFIPATQLPSRSRRAHHAVGARRRQVIATIAGLGERVRGEPDADPEVDELLYDSGVLPRVEVVHQLRALVADISVVLEPRRTLHEPNGSERRQPSAQRRPA